VRVVGPGGADEVCEAAVSRQRIQLKGVMYLVVTDEYLV
jgi:hypothetical protein